MKKKLRTLCNQSPRLSNVDFASYKKEIGAIEIHEMEDYFLYLISNRIKVKNESNCIVAYLVGLTDDKPSGQLEWKGGTIPDIDSDVEKGKRDKVLEYLRYTYGYDRVANIGTYGKFFAKSAIRKVGKALGYPIKDVDRIAKMVPDPEQGRNWSVDDAVKKSKDLQKEVKNNSVASEIVKWASKLDGVIDSRGQHAAGVVIANDPITDLASTWEKENSAILEFTGSESESLGYVKIDLLGLTTLDIIDKTIEIINSRHGMKLKASDIPFDDKDTFKMFSTGNLMGVFQLEGSGMSAFTRELRPQHFMDIALISAGYRPGPLKFMPSILKIKTDRKPDIIPHAVRFPILKDILEETYGYFIYQEQIQKTVQVLAGYNDSEADAFRKIVAKKIESKLPAEKQRFTTKAKEKGMTDDEIFELWDEIEDFSKYAFNKSHSVAYSFLTMQTAWLKTHYTAEFYAANILHELGTKDQVVKLINESKLFGISILPPDINESNESFTVLDNSTIKFGLAGIKGVGLAAAQSIMIDRKKNGKYRTVSEFIFRAKPKSNMMQAMVESGCFDSMAKRSQLLYNISENETYLDHLVSYVKYHITKQWILPDMQGEWIKLPAALEFSVDDLADMEKRFTGLWLSSNPYEMFAEDISKFKRIHKNSKIGFVSDIKMFKKKNGFFFTMGESSAKYFVFERTWNVIKETVSLGDIKESLIGVSGQIKEDDETFFIVYELVVFNKNLSSSVRKVHLDIPLTYDGMQYLKVFEKNKPTSIPAKYYLTVKFITPHYNQIVHAGYLKHT